MNERIGVKQLDDSDVKKRTAREILEALPEWFGIVQAREEYIEKSASLLFFAAFDKENPIGFLALKETGIHTVELAVMGVLKPYHRQGVGRALFAEAKKRASLNGYSFIQVKTVQMGCYDEYDRTNLFYKSLGFKEFEVFPTLWDEANPCQIYVMGIKQ
ncbi:MAG: GNAT family N-acetyltransferase [Lachnospiraceae bacterium]|nr:GNAT family N-acetyltransferase [Lachnospiraceae bacterium]